LVTPAKRGKSKKALTAEHRQDHTPAERRASMTWPLSLTWMTKQQLDCCRIAGPRQAYQWVCSSDGMDPTIALTCCSQFGSGRVFFRQAFGIDVKLSGKRTESSIHLSTGATIRDELTNQ
jgi:hypothetical protein